MTTGKKIHHRRSSRLQGYDYSQAGAYFVTICTRDRECLLGEITVGADSRVFPEMRLNDAGRAVQQCWIAIPDHFPHVELDVFVVMPNHVHGIVVIVDGRGTACRAPTAEQFGCPVSGSIPTIFRSFKSAVTKCINEMRGTRGEKLWQRNYWEHIVRNESELNRIREYIQNNPAQWELDKLYPGGGDGLGTGRGTACRAPTVRDSAPEYGKEVWMI